MKTNKLQLSVEYDYGDIISLVDCSLYGYFGGTTQNTCLCSGRGKGWSGGGRALRRQNCYIATSNCGWRIHLAHDQYCRWNCTLLLDLDLVMVAFLLSHNFYSSVQKIGVGVGEENRPIVHVNVHIDYTSLIQSIALISIFIPCKHSGDWKHLRVAAAAWLQTRLSLQHLRHKLVCACAQR